ncbi:tripartite tricarboxylate transporter substrate binding protein [Variovorax sp. J22G21]|uniref:Bug family tripartite tricarboxylate transporter substrate binding protein n=1 Tax=Variovorax fucosicus TaxID=3053517 RepID=UPI002574C86A|nr:MULTISPECIES: tripartite tricarboxylate transporter substrate binding protein [unclassified Variovorax]MDM0038433.1 tripartite tricarboxylate transporter substrate binding protein [Variovorax sp. J22R193]MDM0063209.1 tripartite tricarboxylate transporter substrate binding protein [Variovorax sp. J22G21]
MKRSLAFLVACGLSLGASAQSWPTKPVKLVVPAPAGSSLDFIARTLGDKLRTRWKQPVVVDNKAGAGGMLGMAAVAKAPADGYTLGIGFNGPIAFGPHMYKKMAYDPAKDLLPIVMTSSQPNVLAVPVGNPAKTLPEFVAWAKGQGGKVNYASVGAGSSSHLTMELFKSVAGFEAAHVPFAGSPPAGISVASDETQALFTVAPALLPLIEGGRIRLLASTSLKRTDTMKNLPTVAESGYPGFEALAWNGLFSAAGTPPDVVSRINADLNEVMKDPAVREAFARQGLIIGGGSPDEFRIFIAGESAKWGAIIKKVGISID